MIMHVVACNIIKERMRTWGGGGGGGTCIIITMRYAMGMRTRDVYRATLYRKLRTYLHTQEVLSF